MDRRSEPVFAAARHVIQCAETAKSASRGKIVFLGALAALFAVGAVPMFVRADAPPVAASSTLKCYDSAGQNERCATAVNVVPSRPSDRVIKAPQPEMLITNIPYQQARWGGAAVEQPDHATASSRVARRNVSSRKYRVSSACERHVIPCVFSTLRRRFTHMISVAASVGRAPTNREHL